jgi:diaminohydroxyphosphoribosylaminopyrimidine deaminase/5-amino-6-(5-phosphoribosylamino)uracil reductase
MKLAFKEAAKGLGYTSPNPAVGAVLIKNGRIITRGYHKNAGGPHAEIEAINKAGRRAKNSTLIVTLEPCSHFGKTPPCADAIINAGISTVVSPVKDPNPNVSGKGFRKLKKTGVEVVLNVGREQATEFYKPYFKFITTGIPYVTLKFAQSVDGRTATATHHSRWISSEQSLRYAHFLRAINDAVLVGTGTLESDNPKLTTRLVKGNNPARIVLTKDGNINFKRSIFNDNEAPTYIAGPARVKINPRNQIGHIKVKMRGEELNLKDLLRKLGKMGIMSLMIEGGSRVTTSFLNQKLVDRLEVCIAPIVIGDGIDSVGDLGIKNVNKSLKIVNRNWTKSGPDMILTGEPVWR